MKKIEINLPSTLGVGERIEFLKVSMEFWKNYYFNLRKFLKDGDECGEEI